MLTVLIKYYASLILNYFKYFLFYLIYIYYMFLNDLFFSETKPVESVLITRDHISSDSVLGPPKPSVVLETTKQCFLTFGADATLSWTSSRVSSLSSAGLTPEGNALPSGAMPWEGLVASVQRQVMCAGGQQDGVVAVSTDRKRKLHSSAMDSPLDHFLCLCRNSLQQVCLISFF